MPIDMPNIPPQNVPVIMAQVEQSQASTMQTGRTIGICHAIRANNGITLENVIDPRLEAIEYLKHYEKMEVKSSAPATVNIIQQPMHAELRLVIQSDMRSISDHPDDPVNPADTLHIYLPEKGFVGKDKAIALVDIGGIKVKVIYFFQAVPMGNSVDEACGKRGYRWKISSSFIPGSSRVLTAS